MNGSVEFYTKADAVVTVNFPEDRVCCQWCPFCRNEDSLKRHKCLITAELLVYPFTGLGMECPLIIREPDKQETVTVKEHEMPFKE